MDGTGFATSRSQWFRLGQLVSSGVPSREGCPGPGLERLVPVLTSLISCVLNVGVPLFCAPHPFSCATPPPSFPGSKTPRTINSGQTVGGLSKLYPVSWAWWGCLAFGAFSLPQQPGQLLGDPPSPFLCFSFSAWSQFTFFSLALPNGFWYFWPL